MATSSSVVNHFIRSIEFGAASKFPYKHVYIQNVFPWDYYDLLVFNLPKDEAYTDRRFDNRGICNVAELETQFWRDLTKWMASKEVFDAVRGKFSNVIAEMFPGKRDFSVDIRLVRDSSSYKINPHTDIKSKAVSLLIYLPYSRDVAQYGTSIYIAKDQRKCDGSTRHEFEDFSKVYTAPFLPNSMLGFARTDTSFHGVEPIGSVTRDVLLYNIYMR